MERIGKPTRRLPRNTILFCEKPWQIPAMSLAVLVVLTFAWGIYIVGTYPGDDYFDDVYDLSVPGFLFRDIAGAGAPQISEAVAPGVVGIGATGVNMPMSASGAIVSSNGHVLTALHPLQGKHEASVRVRTPSGIQLYRAEVVKSLPEHDLVLLKILTAKRFLYFTFADTSWLQSGNRVIGIGNGTSGNIVFKEGSILSTNMALSVGGMQMSRLFGTDAVYSWEQNGGPLVNGRGEIVGINLSIRGASGAVEGYAVPAHVIIAHFGDVVDIKVAGAGGGENDGGKEHGHAVSVPVVGTAPPRAAPGVETGAGGSAAWWAMARRQVAQENSALGVNVAAPNSPPVSAGAPGAPGAAGGVGSAPALFDREHLGGVRIGGFSVGDILSLALLAVAVGVISGMMTMGGGVLQVAGMMVFFGYGMHLIRPVAYLTNLFVFGAAALRNDRSGLVMWETVRSLAPWAMVGVVVGYFIGNTLGDEAIAFLLGVFALLMTAKGLHEIFFDAPEEILLKAGGGGGETSTAADDILDDELGLKDAPGSGPMQEMVERQTRGAFLGLPSGLISGILGISGGVVAVPTQRFFSGVSMQNAIANSSVIVFWASLAGTLTAFMHGIPAGLIDWQAPLTLAAIMIPGAFAGGVVGAKLMKVLPVIALKWFYTVIMAVIAIKMLFLG
ncbi:MAG: magnetosome protein MamO [Rhodospirillales bacterium]